MKNRKFRPGKTLSVLLTVSLLAALLLPAAAGATTSGQVVDQAVDDSTTSVRCVVVYYESSTGDSKEEVIHDFGAMHVEYSSPCPAEIVTRIDDGELRLTDYVTANGLTLLSGPTTNTTSSSEDNRIYTWVPVDPLDPNTENYLHITGNYYRDTVYTVSVTVEWVKTPAAPSYQIVEGADGVWTQGSEADLAFLANGELTNFAGIEVDGQPVDDQCYTVQAGSTALTLKNSYLATLSVGKHTLTMVYSDGECSAEFEVCAAAAPQSPLDPQIPETGDTTNYALWGVLLAASIGALIKLARRRKSS